MNMNTQHGRVCLYAMRKGMGVRMKGKTMIVFRGGHHDGKAEWVDETPEYLFRLWRDESEWSFRGLFDEIPPIFAERYKRVAYVDHRNTNCVWFEYVFKGFG